MLEMRNNFNILMAVIWIAFWFEFKLIDNHQNFRYSNNTFNIIKHFGIFIKSFKKPLILQLKKQKKRHLKKKNNFFTAS